MNNPADHINYEDAFIVDDDDWITLPGSAGRVAPDGTVYDSDGNALYSIYDQASPAIIRHQWED